jgi:glycosyltransferase involved in cell wall biosynthesis
MKILLVNDFGYVAGGAERYLFLLKKGLEQKGHAVFTLSSDYRVDSEKIKTDFQISQSGHFFNLDSYFNIMNYFQFKKILNRVKPDIVHLNNIFYTISPSILFALNSYKTVMTLHDYYIICFRDKTFPDLEICDSALGPICYKKGCVNKRGYIRGKIKKHIIRKGLKNINIFISPSKYLKSEFERNGIKNIAVLPNPVEFEAVSYQEFKGSDALLYIGRLAKQKGVDYLIRAMPEVIKEHPEAILRIAGSGPEENELKKLVANLGVSNNVKFLGWVTGKDKDYFIRESLVIIAPSIWPEVGPFVIFESACYGKALISTNVGGPVEFIEECKTGFLVPPKDSDALAKKILFVLNNKNILSDIRKNIIEKIYENKLDKYIIHLENIYNSLNKK